MIFSEDVSEGDLNINDDLNYTLYKETCEQIFKDMKNKEIIDSLKIKVQDTVLNMMSNFNFIIDHVLFDVSKFLSFEDFSFYMINMIVNFKCVCIKIYNLQK